jgi:hypothetical protein
MNQPLPDPFVNAQSVEDVIARLDSEIERSVREGSRNAYFACLYRSVTQRVLDGIRAGRFEDGPRMARLDAVFANRYLAALHDYRYAREPSKSWRVAFDAARKGNLSILQDLLMGMNAHIGLDLGIAAAEVAPGTSLRALRRDFDEISRLLGEMLDDVQDRLARVSPWLGLLDRVGGRSDEEICSFCLGGSRDIAWKWAEKLARTEAAQLPEEIDCLDRAVVLLTHPIQRPTPMVRTALAVVRAREPRQIERVVAALS